MCKDVGLVVELLFEELALLSYIYIQYPFRSGQCCITVNLLVRGDNNTPQVKITAQNVLHWLELSDVKWLLALRTIKGIDDIYGSTDLTEMVTLRGHKRLNICRGTSGITWVTLCFYRCLAVWEYHINWLTLEETTDSTNAGTQCQSCGPARLSWPKLHPL